MARTPQNSVETLASLPQAERSTITVERILPHVAALVLYTLLMLIVTWPLPAYFTHGVVGADEAVDSYQHIWHQWWVAQALTNGKSPFFTDLLYYPEGIDLFWQTLGFTQGLVAIPITLTLGSVAGVNFTVLSSFVVGGYATFLLARRLSGSVPGALVAGTIYAFSPYHLQKMSEGSIELTSLHWLPLYIFALFLLLEHPSWRRAFLAAALLLWVSLGAWYYGLFAVLFTGCMALVWAFGLLLKQRAAPQQKAQSTRNTRDFLISHLQGETPLNRLLWGMVPLVLWALVLAPKIAGVNSSIDQSSWDMRQAQVAHSADLIDFFLPNPIHPLWGAAVRDWRTALYPDLLTFWNVALGWVGLPLAITGIITAWRRSWRWAALLLATMLLAMGPALRIFGQQTEIPLPFALIQGLPGVRIGQRPSHMAVLAILMLGLLAAFGTAHLVRKLSARASLAVAGALIVAVVAIDGNVERERLLIQQRGVHPFYATLPAPDGALMALPMYVNVNRVEHMNNQIVHHWPIFAGYVARPPDYTFAAYTNGVRELRFGEAVADDILTPGWPEAARSALAAYKIRYVTFDLTTLRGEPKLAAGKEEYFAAVRQMLGELGVGPPLVADDDLEAYALPRDWPVGPVASLGEGWLALERQPDTDIRWRWMGEQAEIRLYNPHDQPVVATVRLQAISFQHARQLHFTLNDKLAGALQIEGEPGPAQSINILLPPGSHTLYLAAEATPDPAYGGQAISVRVFGVDVSFQGPIGMTR